jgi:hypothetical protein
MTRRQCPKRRGHAARSLIPEEEFILYIMYVKDKRRMICTRGQRQKRRGHVLQRVAVAHLIMLIYIVTNGPAMGTTVAFAPFTIVGCNQFLFRTRPQRTVV